MSAAAVLRDLENAGLLVRLSGDALALSGWSKPSPDLLLRLREHKAEIVASLQDGARRGSGRPPAAGSSGRDNSLPPPPGPSVVASNEYNQNAPPAGVINRLAMAAKGGVPEIYADAFARLQIKRPARIDEATWLRDRRWRPAFGSMGWARRDLRMVAGRSLRRAS